MGDIEVAAVYDGLFLVVVREQVRDVAVPGLAVGDSAQVPFGIGNVGRGYIELGKFSHDEAAFAVVFGQAHPHFDAQRGFFGNQCGAAVALLFGRMRIHVVAGAKKHFCDLLFGGLGLLKAHHIRIPSG